ncbi:MAG: hypothetical protein ACNA7V_15105 [Bacteroidales bacterium]
MDKDAKTKLRVLLIGICILALIAYFNIRKKDKIIERLNMEYPLITIDEEIFGQITGVYHIDPKLFRINTNSLEIAINHKIKRRLNVDNEIFTGKRLHDVLAIGDIVLKHGDSATASIFKIHGTDTLEFRFPLLNEKLHPLKK